MKKYTGYWLKRVREKRNLKQKDVAGDEFTRSYVSLVEKGRINLSTYARIYITKRLKLPKSYFDNGLFTDEKKRLDELIIKIDNLSDSERYDEALKLVKEALKISKEAKNDDYLNIFSLKLARILIEKKDLDKAEDILKKVNKYFTEEKDFNNLAYSNYWTAILYIYKKDYEKAVFKLNNSVEVNSKLKIPDLSLKARATTKIAQIYRFIENYRGARQKYIQAINIAKKIKDDYILAMAYWGYSLLMQREGNYSEAIKYYNLASSIYEKLGYEHRLIKINNNLASIYYYKGDHDKVINLTKKVVRISKEKGYEEELSYALLNSAKAKRDKGLLEEAEEDLKESIVLFEKLKDERMLGVAYMTLGLVYKAKKENDKALLNFKKAIEVFKAIGQKTYINSAYGEIIRFYKDIGDLDKEREYMEGLINIVKRVKF